MSESDESVLWFFSTLFYIRVIISWGSINGEESVMNCCSYYKGCGDGRMNAGGGNAGGNMGQLQPTPQGLSYQWGTTAAWAGGSNTPLSHCFKSTNPVSPMSSASYQNLKTVSFVNN